MTYLLSNRGGLTERLSHLDRAVLLVRDRLGERDDTLVDDLKLLLVQQAGALQQVAPVLGQREERLGQSVLLGDGSVARGDRLLRESYSVRHGDSERLVCENGVGACWCIQSSPAYMIPTLDGSERREVGSTRNHRSGDCRRRVPLSPHYVVSICCISWGLRCHPGMKRPRLISPRPGR